MAEIIREKGISISGEIRCKSSVKNFLTQIRDLKDYTPDLIFISTKTFHLSNVLEELEEICASDTKIISTHNGLGTEDLIADLKQAEEGL